MAEHNETKLICVTQCVYRPELGAVGIFSRRLFLKPKA